MTLNTNFKGDMLSPPGRGHSGNQWHNAGTNLPAEQGSGETGGHSFRKSYGLSARDTSHSGPGAANPANQVGELNTPTPFISATPTRPDWLDDDDASHDHAADGSPAEKVDSTPAAPAESNLDAYTGAGRNGYHSAGWTDDELSSSSERSTAKPPAKPAEKSPAKPAETPPAAAAPFAPPAVANPMQLQWFVKEDVTDPWSDVEEDSGEESAPAPARDTVPDASSQEPARNPARDYPARSYDSAPARAEAHTSKAVPILAQPAAIELDLYADRRYRAALERMQLAQWSETLVLLRAVQRDFPNQATLAALINEAELKAGVVDQWADKVQGRRLTLRQEMLLRRAVPIMLLLILFAGAAGFYRAFVEPSRQAVAVTQRTLRALDEAQQLTFAGQFAQAMALYESVLATDPGNPLARQGRRETQELYATATEYELALQVIRAGNLTRAAGMLQNLLVKAPGFRDAETHLARLQTQLTARELLAVAEADFRLQRWLEAVQGYEAVLALNTDFESEIVRTHLQESYYQAGLMLISQWPANTDDIELARDYLRRAATTRRSDNTLNAELNRLDRYFRGVQALERAEVRDAINAWRSIYDEQTQYMGGYLADQLYRAYLNLANSALQQNDTIYAMDLYQLASDLAVKDNSEAVRALEQLRAQAVAPTPTPDATATPAAVAFYQPPVVVPPQPARQPAPEPTPEPTPTATPEPDFNGWIAFRTNRAGGETIFVMQPDGSDQQPAPESIRNGFQQLIEAERLSPDGSQVLSVRMLEGRENPSIFTSHINQAEGTASDVQLTNFNRDEYDPVWSPTGAHIAFVSNHPGNDEIFIMNADGTNHRQLTWNEWEWDKHPTFSPDGTLIAFYTNRFGTRQIYLMNNDGSNQRNISRNTYDDWDPVWIKR